MTLNGLRRPRMRVKDLKSLPRDSKSVVRQTNTYLPRLRRCGSFISPVNGSCFAVRLIILEGPAARRSSPACCARICARMTASLPYPVYESLNHEFAQFTWENSVELTCGDKQRNRENLNFKSRFVYHSATSAPGAMKNSYGSLNSPACSCVSITSPAISKRLDGF